MQPKFLAVLETDTFLEENKWMTRPKAVVCQNNYTNNNLEKPFNAALAIAEIEISKIDWSKTRVQQEQSAFA